MTGKNIFFIIILLLMLPMSAMAIPAITCHCFTDRSYDAAHPTQADPYFLATTQNSFFAALFGVDKKRVVIKKQSGTTSDDLWIAYWIALRTGISADTLLQQKSSVASWRVVVVPKGSTAKKTTEGFQRELQGDASVSALARIVVDDILIQRRLLGESDVAAMRAEWAGNQEIILSVLIASKTGKSAAGLYREVKKGRSWGALLQEAKIEPPHIQQEVAAMLEKYAR